MLESPQNLERMEERLEELLADTVFVEILEACLVLEDGRRRRSSEDGPTHPWDYPRGPSAAKSSAEQGNQISE